MSWALPRRIASGSGPSRRGTGPARTRDLPRTPFTWENARATVRAAAERWAPEKPILIGHSLGAATAIYAAQREPTQLCRADPQRCGGLLERPVRQVRVDRWRPPSERSRQRSAAANCSLTPQASAAVDIVTAARTADVAPVQLWRAARQLTRFDVRDTPPPPIPCAVIVLTDDRRMPPGLQRALARYLGCPHVDVAADHDAPVRQAARFYDGVQTALTALRGNGKVSPLLPQPVALVDHSRGEDPL